VITPRRTRLVRVPDLHAFRDAIRTLTQGIERHPRSLFVVVPSAGAARQLERRIRERRDDQSAPLPDILTRDDLYDRLHARLTDPPRRLSSYERDVIAQASAREASTSLGLTLNPPMGEPSSLDAFPELARDDERRGDLRAGLVAEMLRFYDHVKRLRQPVSRFEALLEATLEGEAAFDRGAERMLRQTRLLAATFRAYERRVAESGACDEHTLREHLVAGPLSPPVRAMVVTVADWIGDPDGLHPADFDLLARLSGLETIDLLATEGTLQSGFHQRVREWLPDLDEIELDRVASLRRPLLVVPPATPDEPWFVNRDREEELIDVARRLDTDAREGIRSMRDGRALDRVAVVYQRPLPYVYLAREVFGSAGIPYQTADAPPLAAEPFAAALDLVLEFVSSSFARAALIALLRSPHFRFGGTTLDRDAIAALDRALSDTRYLGGFDHLTHLATTCQDGSHASHRTALLAAAGAAQELLPLRAAAPASAQIARLLAFLHAHEGDAPLSSRPSASSTRGEPVEPREPQAFITARGAPPPLNAAGTPPPPLLLSAFALRNGSRLSLARAAALEDSLPPGGPQALRAACARAATTEALEALGTACRAHDDPLVDAEGLRSIIHRSLEGQTFGADRPERQVGLQLLDEQAARYGDFDDITIVGLVDGEWPERPRRNIFYSPGLLRALGWPSERDWLSAARARFVDLLASSNDRVRVSTITLDDEALVEPSPFLDEVARAGLAIVVQDAPQGGRLLIEDALSIDPVVADRLEPETRAWAELRLARSSSTDAAFHGQTGAVPARPWSVSAIETYLECPFKFLARHVLHLEDEPDDEEVMDPRRQGAFVHKVFERFFHRWQAHGRRQITVDSLDEARALFEDEVEHSLGDLPSSAEASLERTRLLGSPAAAGLGEAVFRMEAERPLGVVGRLLEERLEGAFLFRTAAGSRTIVLKGKADRIDLLADGTFRLIDYKLGRPPNRARALQLPIYGLCAEQRLRGHQGRDWALGEAAYVAFKGPKRLIPLFTAGERDRVLGEAQERLVAAIDRIARGEFPPQPDDVYRCQTCSYAAVCRTDYVDDV
jgi:RecB family exonuclease